MRRMAEISLRAAQDSDRDLILQLEKDGMEQYATDLWGIWRPSATPASLDLEGHEIVRLSDLDVGCVLALRQKDHLRISKLYVDRTFRGLGIGAAVLGEKVRAASALRLPVRLSVLKSNIRARRFYEREGFILVEQTDERWLLQRAHV